MLVYERLNLVVSFTLTALTLYLVIDFPSQEFTFEFLGQSIHLLVSSRLLMVILMGGLTLSGAGAVIRSHPTKYIPYSVPFWANATLMIMLAVLILAQLGSPINWAIGLGITGVLLWLTIFAEYCVIDNDTPLIWLARLWSLWVSYGLMVGVVFTLYELQQNQWLILGSIFLMTWLLTLSIIKLYASAETNLIAYGFILALGVTQIVWALSYWPINQLSLSLMTLLIFYDLCGLVIAQLQARLSLHLCLEYTLVTGIGLSLIARFVG